MTATATSGPGRPPAPPAARAEVSTPAQVAEAVGTARERGLRVAVQATGHGAKALGSLDDSLLLDLSGMDWAEVDPGRGVARVGGGATWRALVEAAEPHGLLAPFGTAASVGVTGFALGGGVGPLGRQLGLAGSAIVAAELVTASGEVVRTGPGHEPDLLWALRGGACAPGVVTELELALAQQPRIFAGAMSFPGAAASEALAAWAEWTAGASPRVTSSLRLVQPEPGSVLAVVTLVHTGDEWDARREVAPLTELGPARDTTAVTGAAAFLEAHSDPAPGDGPPVELRHALIDHLPRSATEVAYDLVDPAKGSGVLMTEIRHLGGALAEPAPRPGALERVDARYALTVCGPPAALEEVERVVDVLSVFGRGRSLLNFATAPADRRTAFKPAALARLRAVHESLDPHNLFRHPHPIQGEDPC